jgi:cyclopropane fatty-acyl-phospholipid synthase-like methyltransferase
LLKFLTNLAPTIRLHFKSAVPQGLEDPDHYVGTDDVSGRLQFELLKREGCSPDSKLLEIGCGNLHGAVPLIEFLEKANYVGLDPNEWLREAAMKKRYIRQLVKKKQATFLSVDDFDASGLDIKFDFAFAHSVLSHCAHWQLGLFLRNVSKVLAPNGRIVASIRLAEGNAYGSSGTPGRDDSRDETWQYPGVTWFKLATVRDVAEKEGLTVLRIPEYTEFYIRTRPNEYHDWLLFRWKPK